MELRKYQEEDVQFGIVRPAVGFFNEPRTGKTPTALMAALRKGCHKILIICPASLLYNWKYEYERWIGEPCVVITGTQKQQHAQADAWTSGCVINYELIRNTKRNGKVYEGFASYLKAQNPDCIIVDEAHRMKNSKSSTTKALFKLKNTGFRIALTGTPANNKLHDVWPILHWLYPDFFSSKHKYYEEFFVTYENQFATYDRLDTKGTLKPNMESKLMRQINSIATMRKRKDVMPWIPNELTPIKIRLPKTKEQAKYLDEMAQYFETEHLITQGVLDQRIRMLQICQAPALLGLAGGSPKLKWLHSYTKDYPGESIVIFSRHTKFLQYLKEHHAGIELIVGDTPFKNRTQLINDFQSGKVKILAVQIQTGKEGVTLDRANTIIFMDQSPPASDIIQASDRLVPTNPKMAEIPKKLIHVMIADSIDELEYQLTEQRIEETDIINNFITYLKE